MQKIKTLVNSEFGQSRTTGVGTLKFDEETGIAEVDCTESEAKALCNASPSLTLVEEILEPAAPAAKAKTVKTPAATPEGAQEGAQGSDTTENQEKTQEGAQGSVDEPSQEELDALKELLSEKTIDELRSLCQDAEIDEAEYKEFKGAAGKTALVDFMVSKRVGL